MNRPWGGRLPAAKNSTSRLQKAKPHERCLAELAGKKLRTGVDLGGTKIELSPSNPTERSFRRFAGADSARATTMPRRSRSRWAFGQVERELAAGRHRRRRHSRHYLRHPPTTLKTQLHVMNGRPFDKRLERRAGREVVARTDRQLPGVSEARTDSGAATTSSSL